jgi:hypothetical protein
VTAILLCTAAQPELVLCHGADGHVVLERAGAHCCESETAGQRAAPDLLQALGASVPGCGDCFDVTLRVEAAPLRRSVDSTTHIVQPDVVFQATALFTSRTMPRLDCHRGTYRGPGSERELVKLRTVVLIC